MLLDIPTGEDTHANPFSDSPLRYIAVGVATVVRKPTNTAALGGIDELGVMVNDSWHASSWSELTSSFCRAMK